MPSFRHDDVPVDQVTVDVVAVGVAADGDDVVADPTAAAVEEALGADLAELCDLAGMDGSRGARMLVPGGAGLAARLVVVVGLGDVEDVDADAIRTASGVAAHAASRRTGLATTLHGVDIGDPVRAAAAVVEGVELAHDTYRADKTDEDHRRLEQVTLVGGEAAVVDPGLDRGRISADATLLARTLGNTPSADKRPPALADQVVELLADLPVEVEVWGDERLREEGFGGHLAVSAGSSVEARFVRLTYQPDDADHHVALVGKGVTFDSGGLSLKSPQAMEWMKVDMAGAAAVVAAVRAAARAHLPVRVTGMLCLAENMPSGNATRPGDVITMSNGTTVEVLNTDAEGRLVMADALGWADHLEPPVDHLVDIATLTGAAITALGPRITAAFGTDDDLVDQLLAAAERADEPMWRLPLGEDVYAQQLHSDVADLRNVGGSGAGAVRAALFLREFVPDGMAWAHLDIAGPSYNDDAPHSGYVPKRATGIPVRTLVEWLGAVARRSS